MSQAMLSIARVPTVADVGGWVEVGRTTLGAPNTTINVTGLPNKRYYMIIDNVTSSDGSVFSISPFRFNGDIFTTNYNTRLVLNGASEFNSSGSSSFLFGSGFNRFFDLIFISSLSTSEKLIVGRSMNSPASVFRSDFSAKYTDTANPISQVNVTNSSTTFTTGSEVIVLGWDPSDTHTTNFWEELDSVTASGSSPTLDTNIFTPKKYLYVETYSDNASSFIPSIQVGNNTIDTGTNYVFRESSNGAVDITASGQTLIQQENTSNNTPVYANFFMTNFASDEKFSIMDAVRQNTPLSTAPSRKETYFKWEDTTNQANIIRLVADAGNLTTDSKIKVWGHD